MIERQTNNRTIVKNTFFLYFRMMFTMLVTLYTSRVILQMLGVNDYGIYQTVGGVAVILSFISTALSSGSSRFLTYELGKKDEDKLRRTFSTVLAMHLILAFFIFLLAETIGLWFVYNKLQIPTERMGAAVFAYHFSILTVLAMFFQVPFNASIISHEKMNVYAYLSIIETVLKLLIVYLLAISDWDKLKLYAIFLCTLQIGITWFYRNYCTRNFVEIRSKCSIDRAIIKDVLNYSGWNLWSSASIALNNQGATILINVFFSPAIVTARAIANQVNMAANQFVQNFRIAVNPQIVKRYAAEDYQGSKDLLCSSTKYSYFMMLALCLPICLVTEPLLRLWLGIVPDYTVIFLQLTLVTSLFQVFDTSFYTALYAKGRIKENALISPLIGFLVFPIVYLLFKSGYTPVVLAWALLACYVLLGLVVKPILIIKIVGYTWRDTMKVFMPCFKVTILAIPLPLVIYVFGNKLGLNEIYYNLTLILVSLFCVILSVWIIGINKEMKSKLFSSILKKIRSKK